MKKIIALLITSTLFAGAVLAEDAGYTLEAKDNLKLVGLNSLKICAKSNKDCIYDYQVLRDLYSDESISAVSNYGIVKNNVLVTLINSVKYDDGKDLYAIFLAQSTKFDGQGLSSCHACPPTLGIVVYQFHNKWKLFSSNNNVTGFGSFGKISISQKEFSVLPMASEKFIILLKSTDGGQGYETTTTSIIKVNTDSLYDINSKNTVKMRQVGYITSGASNCGAGADGDGEEWTSKILFNKMSNSRLPSIKIIKSFNKCGSKLLLKKETVVLNYDWSKEKYSESNIK